LFFLKKNKEENLSMRKDMMMSFNKNPKNKLLLQVKIKNQKLRVLKTIMLRILIIMKIMVLIKMKIVKTKINTNKYIKNHLNLQNVNQINLKKNK